MILIVEPAFGKTIACLHHVEIKRNNTISLYVTARIHYAVANGCVLPESSEITINFRGNGRDSIKHWCTEKSKDKRSQQTKMFCPGVELLCHTHRCLINHPTVNSDGSFT